MLYIKKVFTKEPLNLKKPSCLTLGMFDGFHIGHQSLIRSVTTMAKKHNALSGILTFKNHPLSLLAPSYSPPSILTPEEKKAMAELFGVELFCQIEFNHALADLSPEEFVENILVRKLKVKGVCVGFNFGFGKNGSGTTKDLVELGIYYGFEVKIIDPIVVNDVIISSTCIREMLDTGNVEQAAEYLTYPHSIAGEVKTGYARGRHMGYPTANIFVDKGKVIPARGVYAVIVKTDGKMHGGMMNIGQNPTFAGDKLSLEVNIFDFNKNLVGKNIRVYFIARLRDEKKFESAEQLCDQLFRDKEDSLDILNNMKKTVWEKCRKIKI